MFSAVSRGVSYTRSCQLSETGKIEASPLGSTQRSWGARYAFQLLSYYGRSYVVTDNAVLGAGLAVGIFVKGCFLFPTSFAITSFAITKGAGTF